MPRPERLRLPDLWLAYAPMLDAQRAANRAAMQRVAASLPGLAASGAQSAPHTREAASPARDTASTTSTLAGGPSWLLNPV